MSISREKARFNMVEQQVRPWDVLDSGVLDALREVPREDFVADAHRRLAFSDLRLPLGHGQVMMRPVEEGRMLQALEIEPGQRVLEIGTGSGFTSTCMAYLGARVLSVELFEDLAESAAERIERSGIDGVEVLRADALGEFSPSGQFDVVAVTASAAEVPERFLQWVRPGGRLFAVRGFSPVMEAVGMIRTEGGHWGVESLFDTDVPRLIGAEDQPRFEF